MKSVMQQFVDRTSQCFEEYDERMNEKRQKSKEQRDKNVQKIIEKDKIEKSLAEKVETGCLKYGCGLGGVAGSVGIFGTVAVKELTKAAITTATELAKEAAKDGAMAATIKAAGAEAGKKFVIAGLGKLHVSTLDNQILESYFATTKYTNVTKIARAINEQYNPSSCLTGGSGADNSICPWAMENFFAARKIPGKVSSTYNSIEVAVKSIVSDAEPVATAAAQQATEEAIKNSIAVVDAKYVICQNAIIASVVALLIIVLIMIIIYLVLRYRRKNKMNKKAHYTKLLKE